MREFTIIYIYPTIKNDRKVHNSDKEARFKKIRAATSQGAAELFRLNMMANLPREIPHVNHIEILAVV